VSLECETVSDSAVSWLVAALDPLRAHVLTVDSWLLLLLLLSSVE